KQQGENNLSELDSVLHQKGHGLSILREQNKDLEFEIQDVERRTNESKQTVRKIAIDQEHIKLKIVLSEKQWKPVKDELQKVSVQHGDTKGELERLERQSFLEDMRTRVR
ncbi:hypothetical protein DNTS_005820, partial [Danionella cerebrum]